MKKNEIAAYIDQTLLAPTATEEELASFVTKAKDFGFASVCINPVYIKKAKELLAGSTTKVCTVTSFSERKRVVEKHGVPGAPGWLNCYRFCNLFCVSVAIPVRI